MTTTTTTTTRPADPDSIRQMVSEGYSRVAERSQCGCGCGTAQDADRTAQGLGYEAEQLEALPNGANLGLGCGNPTAIGSLRPGEVVVDLGSGAGIDVFLAAKEVGPSGRVIGVDMTDAMLEKARHTARAGGYSNGEFSKGKIEELPVEDDSVDVILSNCVINLSPEKEKVYREAYRVLKPGGRMMISDIVLKKDLPQDALGSVDAWVGCIGGAIPRSDYLQTIDDAGFTEIRVDRETKLSDSVSASDPWAQSLATEQGLAEDRVSDLLDAVISVNLFVRK